jgi:hypothetical protein
MVNVEKRVNAKYNTKNNIKEMRLVFLPIKNHKRAKIMSRKNLRLTKTII